MYACSLFSSPSLFTLYFFSHTCACKHPQVYSHTHTVVSHLQSSSCRAVAEVATADTPHALSRPNESCLFFCLFYAIVPSFPYLRCRRQERSFSSSVSTVFFSALALSISRMTTHSCRSRALVLEKRQNVM